MSLIETLSLFGVGSIVGGIVINWFKNRLEQSAENKRKVRDEKEKQYKAFLNNLLGFFDAWKNDYLQLQFMWDLYAKAPVYASDEVLRLAYRYIKSFDSANKANDITRQRIYAKLVLAIRNELNKITGESESELKEEEVRIMGLDTVKENVKKDFLKKHIKVLTCS